MSGEPSAVQQQKEQVRQFWDRAACGEELLLPTLDAQGFRAQAEERYRLEPFIPPFAKFDQAAGRDVLEIGLGLGADHERFAAAGARLHGIDLTARAVEMTRRRLAAGGWSSQLRVGDAEALPYPDASFDLVYSWGVVHHSPNTQQAIDEIHRVLRPGAVCRVMIYHKLSLVGLMLWARYALLTLRPWRSLEDIYDQHLESPGTKAYTRDEAARMFAQFRDVRVQVELTHGDLLASRAGQRHRGPLLSTARKLWPRRLLRRYARGFGLFMLIEATK